MPFAGRLTVLHLAPHPDDEAIGAPATLLALRGAGHRVVNLACSLGRPEQHGRRLREVREACARLDVELLVHDPPLALSAGDDLARAQAALTAAVTRLVAELEAELVLAPTPHDAHHAHEVVGRAVRDAVAAHARDPVVAPGGDAVVARARDALAAPGGDAVAAPGGPRLWLWALWAELPLPTLYAPVAPAELERALEALRAHAGELERNDYGALVRARALAARVLGAERVFGYGAPTRGDAPFAELLTEVVHADGEWWAGAPRALDPQRPLAPVPHDRPVGWWLDAPSFAARLRAATEALRG